MVSNVLKNLISDFFDVKFENFKIVLMDELNLEKQIGIVFYNDGVFIEFILYDNNEIEVIRLDEGTLYGKNILMYNSQYGRIKIKNKNDFHYSLTFNSCDYIGECRKIKNTVTLKEPLFNFEKVLVLNKIGGVDACKELVEVHLDEEFVVI